MQKKTRFFTCTNPHCGAKIGVVGTQVGSAWTPPRTVTISGHTEGDRGIVPCSVRGEYFFNQPGIGSRVPQTKTAHA